MTRNIVSSLILISTLLGALLRSQGGTIRAGCSIMLVIALALQPIGPAPVGLAAAGKQPHPGDGMVQGAQQAGYLYLPLVVKPPAPPSFEIISPLDGAQISGSLYFAVQVTALKSVESVAFQAGGVELGSDSSAADGFRVFLDAGDFAAGLLQLTAIADGPSGQTAHSITVNVVDNPPSSATIGPAGGVLASEIGSVISIPPSALSESASVSVDELSQEEVTAQNHIDWESLGVTFLGAQAVQTGAEPARPLGVSSAGFGSRVQPGQAVVNYRILPDVDGDGVDEIVVVNTASVAPNNDVISDPIPQAALKSTITVYQPDREPQQVEVISGPPGTRVEIDVSGFNPLSLSGNLGIWTSAVDGKSLNCPAWYFCILLIPASKFLSR